jgi:hypothetical protein
MAAAVPIIGAPAVARQGDFLKRNRARTVAWVAAVLLVAIALSACGGRRATTPAANPSAPGGGSGASGPGSSLALPTDQPTMDPVASELDQINQLINDINDSIESSDTSSEGGE